MTGQKYKEIRLLNIIIVKVEDEDEGEQRNAEGSNDEPAKEGTVLFDLMRQIGTVGKYQTFYVFSRLSFEFPSQKRQYRTEHQFSNISVEKQKARFLNVHYFDVDLEVPHYALWIITSLLILSTFIFNSTFPESIDSAPPLNSSIFLFRKR